MPPSSDAIADCVLSAFKALPAKCKPRGSADGRREWVPLAGVVLSRGSTWTHSVVKCSADVPAGRSDSEANEPGFDLTCAALATGMKCLPHAKLPLAHGNVLHDWHAEILAIRAFNRWLLDECEELVRKGREAESRWVAWRQEFDGEKSRSARATTCEHVTRSEMARDQDSDADRDPGEDFQGQPFSLRKDVRIHLYISDAPCGDASMELTMAAQPDSTPWTSQPADGDMLGRGNFDRLGVVRRKPARPDAPVTLSKSCSDKLAMKQCTGLLSGPVSLLIHPGDVYLETLVLPEERYASAAVERAFGRNGRMMEVENIGQQWHGGYAFKAFTVCTTSRLFEYANAADATESQPGVVIGSNISTLSTLSGRQEVVINGVLQGRKQTDPKGASCVSRRKMWEAVCRVEDAMDPAAFARASDETYAEFKASSRLRSREQVKRDVKAVALRGWKANAGDAEWRLSS
ncbi:hypothetical protein LTR56_018289 [Elasticomyces elasticus]|nr:hypothetical protein LTR56_018289 [Elasticomyces elasticus]KAK3636779.1 hypothetical protein LTR22_018594 [Elasticomyces elasticus]KAK4912357.1 hypothetical protein LTR49_019175 [Elasticomyces elasticus]KAK5751848.1 hypothetical protein LTS12_018089 [Elasticomyces elasticus]